MVLTTHRFRLQVYIATLFLALIGLFSFAMLTVEYLQAREIMRSAAETRFNKIEEQISSDIELRYDFASFALALVADSTVAVAPSVAVRLEQLPMLVQILRDRPLVRAVKIGYDSGDFFLVRSFLPNGRVAKLLKPPAATAYVVQSGERGAVGDFAIHYLYFDQALMPLGEGTIPGDVIDVRTRPWFQAAAKDEETVVTQPYALATTQEPTTTVARRVRGGHSVVAIDITLASLTRRLRVMRPTPSAEIAIVNEAREVLAASDLTDEQLVDDVPDANQTAFGTRRGGVIDKAIADANSGDTIAPLPYRQLQRHRDLRCVRFPARNPWGAALSPDSRAGGAIAGGCDQHAQPRAPDGPCRGADRDPLTLVCSRLASRPLGALTREAAAIRALKFDEPTRVHSFIAEIDVLAQTMDSMKSTIRRFLEIGARAGQ